MALAASAYATSPPSPPSGFDVFSPNCSFLAVADPYKDVVSVFESRVETPVWSLGKWYRSFALANDGDHVVIFASGLDPLRKDIRQDGPALVFMRRTETVRVLTVGQFQRLARKVSRSAWMVGFHISARNQLIAELFVDDDCRCSTKAGAKLAFSVLTGKVEAEMPFSGSSTRRAVCRRDAFSAPLPPPPATYERGRALERQGKGAEAVQVYVVAGGGKAAKRLCDIYGRGIDGVPRDAQESRKWCRVTRLFGE